MNNRLIKLQDMAHQIRLKSLESIYAAGSGHPGGSFSAAEIMALLYFDKMRIDPNNPASINRDRFILSKGHTAPLLYSTLALRGFFPVEELQTLRKLDSRLQGHPAYQKLPGVDMVSGSLGQGLSIGLGMLLSGRRKNMNFRVFVLLGDGECQEGSVWEAAMAAAFFKPSGLIAILDYNQVQLDGAVSEIMRLDPLADKWRAFGWQVIECDGHNIEQLDKTMELALDRAEIRPVIIIADTVKGKGVSFMEHKSEWHGNCPSVEQYETAVHEINEARKSL
jgi:transketolase